MTDLVISTPHGPYNRREYAEFCRAAESLPPGGSMDRVITGGNGVGYPGYYGITAVAFRRTTEEQAEHDACMYWRRSVDAITGGRIGNHHAIYSPTAAGLTSEQRTALSAVANVREGVDGTLYLSPLHD